MLIKIYVDHKHPVKPAEHKVSQKVNKMHSKPWLIYVHGSQAFANDHMNQTFHRSYLPYEYIYIYPLQDLNISIYNS